MTAKQRTLYEVQSEIHRIVFNRVYNRPISDRKFSSEEYLNVLRELSRALKEVENLTDKIDLWRDEFIRIKVITKNLEIIGLCNRALADIEQKVPVVVRCKELEEENNKLRCEIIRWREELLKLKTAMNSAFDAEVKKTCQKK